MQTIHNVINDISPSQEHQYHHQLQQRTLEMSSFFEEVLDSGMYIILNTTATTTAKSIFDSVLDAFKLNRF